MPSKLFSTPSSARYISALSFLAVLLFSAIAIYSSPLKPGIPAIQLTFSAATFNDILFDWSAAGVHRFKLHFLLDYPFLVAYGALGYLVATQTRLFEIVAPMGRMLLAALLPVAALADATENALHLFFLFSNDSINPALYVLAGTVASLKWLLIVVYVACSALACFSAANR